jgi:hypothetical protein
MSNSMKNIAAVILLMVFVLIIILLAFISNDIPAAEAEISQYLVGHYSWLAIFAFLSLATAATLCAIMAYGRGDVRLCLVLCLYSLAVAVVGLTKPDQALHAIAALTAFASIPAGVLANTAMNKRDRYIWLTTILGSFLLWPVIGFPYGERVTVLIETAWLLGMTAVSDSTRKQSQ